MLQLHVHTVVSGAMLSVNRKRPQLQLPWYSVNSEVFSYDLGLAKLLFEADGVVRLKDVGAGSSYDISLPSFHEN